MELDDQSTPAQRRADLLTFTTMAAREMAEVARGMPEKLDEIAKHVRHVEGILADQEHYSRASRVVEAVDLDEVVRESLKLLAPEIRRAMAVEIEPGVRRRVLASPVALQQVVSNLVINAAEAIRRAGRRDSEGRLHVSADTERVDGIEMVHARFQDNGAGISPEHLQRIFERGFSTKQQKPSGLGLHWTGNTVTALNGRIYAQSEGAGKGACLHLLLPSAVARPETQPK